MKAICYNDTFYFDPSVPFKTYPKNLTTHTINRQEIHDGQLYVGLEGFKGLMFNFQDHFILIQE